MKEWGLIICLWFGRNPPTTFRRSRSCFVFVGKFLCFIFLLVSISGVLNCLLTGFSMLATSEISLIRFLQFLFQILPCTIIWLLWKWLDSFGVLLWTRFQLLWLYCVGAFLRFLRCVTYILMVWMRNITSLLGAIF